MTTKVTYSFLNRAIIIYSSLILIFFIKVLRKILRKNVQGEAAERTSKSQKDNKRGSAAPASMQPPAKKPKSAKTAKHAENPGEDDMEGIVDADPEQT